MLILRNKTWHMSFRNLEGRLTTMTLNTSNKEEAVRLEELYMAALRANREALKMERSLSRLGMVGRSHGPSSATSSVATEKTPANVQVPSPDQPNILEPVHSNPCGVPLASIIEMAGKRIRLTNEHRWAFRRFCAWAGDCFASDVTPKLAQEYLDEEYKGKSAKTYNSAKSALNTVFKAALVEAGLSSSPFEPLMCKKNDDVTHTRDFTDEEVSMMLNATEDCPYWHCLIMIAANTGFRLKDCKSIAPCHISDGIITFVPNKTSNFGRGVQIPLLPELKAYLSTVPSKDSNTPYCEAFQGKRWWQGNKTLYFAGLLQSLGISKIENGERATFHSFRDTFATRMSKAGISDRVMRGILGHTTQKMTDLYNHDTASAVREMAAAFGCGDADNESEK